MQASKHPTHKTYYAEEDGRVYEMNGTEVRQRVSRLGYSIIHISIKGRRRTTLVHRFVYQCFNGELETSDRSGESLVVYHLDGNLQNNSRSNLATATLRDRLQMRYDGKKSSKYVGVTYHAASNKYIGRISLRGLGTKYLGYWSELEAAMEYDDNYELARGIRPNELKYPDDFAPEKIKANDRKLRSAKSDLFLS